MPKININVKSFELDLIDEFDTTENKISLSIQNIIGQENKALSKNEINFNSISFQILGYYLIKEIELKYLFDEKT